MAISCASADYNEHRDIFMDAEDLILNKPYPYEPYLSVAGETWDTRCQQGPGFERNCPKTRYRHHVFGWKSTRHTLSRQETEASWQ